jgi:hypothetical protein
VILIEHATILTVDAERRALDDRVERLSRQHVRRAGVPVESAWPVVG